MNPEVLTKATNYNTSTNKKAEHCLHVCGPKVNDSDFIPKAGNKKNSLSKYVLQLIVIIKLPITFSSLIIFGGLAIVVSAALKVTTSVIFLALNLVFVEFSVFGV